MQALRAHHTRELISLLEKVYGSLRWSKDSSQTIESIVDQIVRNDIDLYAETYFDSLQRPEDSKAKQLAINYIGPNAENYSNFKQAYFFYYTKALLDIIKGEATIRIQTDPTSICEGCWLKDNREIGIHCSQETKPHEERESLYPYYDTDVVVIFSLSDFLGIPILEEQSRIEGMRNLYLDIPTSLLRESLVKENGEFRYSLLYKLGGDLRSYFESISDFSFDYILYVYNQYG